jgi:uncharacterized membrane protein YjjB (DUF3815 family)
MCTILAISGVLDLLQGSRVVYAVIEIMSRHTVSGADLIEGLLFTTLITYFLQFGSYTAASILGDGTAHEFTQCTHGMDKRWYFLFVPLACLSWAVIFKPYHRDLPGMTFHGILGFAANYGLTAMGASMDLNYFVSASLISLSAGIYSRYVGVVMCKVGI